MNRLPYSTRGSARLVFDTVRGVTNIVQRTQASVVGKIVPGESLHSVGAMASGIFAAPIYATIRGISGALGVAVDESLMLWPSEAVGSNTEVKAIAGLNGALGDHLEALSNPLATKMCFVHNGLPIEVKAELLANVLPQASSDLVVMVHGLCMSEHCWQRDSAGLGDTLHRELDLTALYLRYNSGRHISTNGQEFSLLLGELCEAWPVAVTSLTLIGHSMGGLVIRSACHYAEQDNRPWLVKLQQVVCLGTPHHGSPLEKAGYGLDVLLQNLPFTETLALTTKRSAGIKDLRYGNLLDEDWHGIDPDRHSIDRRKPVPLVPGVEYYFAAATVGPHQQDIQSLLLGDLLVRLNSAVGEHSDDTRCINVKPGNCRVFYRKHHIDLLCDPVVQAQVISWLTPKLC
ncbi:MAG: pimeloyl-ACP methyl ester carboxylesterase [Halieaceae bacterium]|jgi:pimeloyl-ACP methyl ester carboxylesterase